MLKDKLIPWEYPLEQGQYLRGWHSPPSSRPVIHFIHGNGYCGLVYEKMLAPLTEHFDLFISDAQGHGDSDVGSRYHGWNGNVAHFAEVWRHYSVNWAHQPKIAMGHSYGGVCSALVLAGFPELFDSAILLDPVFFTPNMARMLYLVEPTGMLRQTPLARRSRVRKSYWLNAQEAWDYFYQRGMFKGWDDDCLRSYIVHALELTSAGLKLKCPPSRESEIFASFPKQLWRNINKIKHPVHVLYGDNTYPFVQKAAKRIGGRFNNFRVESVAGRHCFMQERPLEIARRIETIALEMCHKTS